MHVKNTKRRRDTKPQSAMWGVGLLTRDAFNLVNLLQDMFAAFIIDASGFGQTHTTRCPVEQAGTQMFLELHNRFTYLGARQSKPVSGSRESLIVHHLDKDRHAVKFIHIVYQKETIRLFIAYLSTETEHICLSTMK